MQLRKILLGLANLIIYLNCKVNNTAAATTNFELLTQQWFPKIQKEPEYDLQYLNTITKHHGYTNDEINRIHFLGSFSSNNQRNDELTLYLHYVGKITTAVHLIYNYEAYLQDFVMRKRIQSYNAQLRYYCNL